MRDVAPDLLRDYACEDADVTWQLKEILEKEIENAGLQSLFNDVEMPLVRVLFTMEKFGVSLDTESLKLYSVELKEQILKIESEIIEMAGVEFNVASPKQVGDVLFDQLKIDEKAKKTKTGSILLRKMCWRN